jgi:AcrR family transcriptional regulator
MLLHHFRSREELLLAIVEEIERRQAALLADLPDDPADAVAAVWADLRRPELRSFERLFFECYARAAATGGGVRMMARRLVITRSRARVVDPCGRSGMRASEERSPTPFGRRQHLTRARHRARRCRDRTSMPGRTRRRT